MRVGWKAFFMLQAKLSAIRSGCNSRPTGAVIVRDHRILAGGYNGTVTGRSQCTDFGKAYCHRRMLNGPEDDKYNICPSVHAEANAIAQAAKMGIPLDGSECYCTLQPCYVCLKQLKASGIVKVYYELEYQSPDAKRDKIWSDFSSVDMLSEKLVLSELEIQAASAIIQGITSKRLLGPVSEKIVDPRAC